MKNGVTEVQTRQPTLEEAVQHVMRSLSHGYRRTCLEHWERLYGAQYSESVRREVTKRWAKKGIEE